MPPIPRTISIYWHDATPDFVLKCVDSWKRLNPTWRITLYTDSDFPAPTFPRPSGFDSLGLAHKSDWIRLKHMEVNGGVYVDASTVCVRAVESWVDIKEERVQGFKVRASSEVKS